MHSHFLQNTQNYFVIELLVFTPSLLYKGAKVQNKQKQI